MYILLFGVFVRVIITLCNIYISIYNICAAEAMAEAVGCIRRAIVRAKRELRNLKDVKIKESHSERINQILGIINQQEFNTKEKKLIIELFQSLKNSNDNDLGLDFLDTLETYSKII